MKKILFFLIISIMLFNINVYALNDPIPNAKSGILIETSNKKIIYEKNKDLEVSIASLTKMMGLTIIFEKIEKGDISYDDIVTVSKNASDMGGSQIYLSEGEKMSVRDLLKGIIMASANDGIVAMAEYVAGTEESFVEMMNDKAIKLGLNHTHFVNPTGLDEEGHYSSAYDVAMIAIELMSHPDVFNFTTLYEDYLRKDTKNSFWLVNTNKLLKSYNGVDGLKTGMTDNAGYCMAVTAKRNNMRLLAITLGEKEGKVRNSETASLLDYGFNLYEVETIKKQGEVVGKITFDKAIPKTIEVTVKDDVTILKKKSDEKKEYTSEVKLNNPKLPLNKGDIIGKLLVKDESSLIKSVDLITNIDIKKQSFFNLYLNLLKS